MTQIELTFAAPGILPTTSRPEARTISGIAVPFGVASGPTENGRRYRFYGPPTNVDELVELVREHDDDDVIGRLVGWDLSVGALGVRARLFKSTAGSDALIEASEKVRTGLSVGAEVDESDVVEAADGVFDVGRWTARHVGLVRRPAFVEATVQSIAAHAAPELDELDGTSDYQNESSPARKDQVRPLTDSSTTAALPETVRPLTDTTPTDPDGDDEDDQDEDVVGVVRVLDDLALVELALSVADVRRAATNPGGTMLDTVAAPTENRRRVNATAGPRTPGEAARSISLAAARIGLTPGETDPGRINAALSDVVPGDGTNGIAGAYLRPAWIGELWTPENSRRPFVDALGSTPLTSMSWDGWKWGVRPEVEDYAGNKAPIPTNEVTILPATGTAGRIAGGWDVDRIFTDLGSPDFIESMFGAAAQDYAIKSEAKLAADVLAGASVAPGAPTTLVEALTSVVSALTSVGAAVSFVAMAADLWVTFISLPASEVPWWLQAQGTIDLAQETTTVAGVHIFVDVSLPAGTVIGGDRRAADFRDTGPIRLQALNIPNAGVDIALVGYQGTLIHDDRAIVKTTVAAAPPPLRRSSSSS